MKTSSQRGDADDEPGAVGSAPQPRVERDDARY
jgi:hypothetical protein